VTDIRLAPTAALTASVVALVLWAVQNPHAAMWAVVVALVLAVGGLFTQAIEAVRLREDLADADRRVEALEADLMAARLTDPATATTVPVPLLRLVPTQRTGIHDHLAADDDWFARLYDENGTPRA